MISTAHPTKDTVSVGARGLGGMSYFLHVFWDTEIFALPFYIYTHPQTARTLLAYRFRNLAGAREKARHMGHKGALYPWESADKGVETHAALRLRPRRRDGPHPQRAHGAPHLGGRRLGRVGVLEGHRRRRLHGLDGRGDDAGDGALLGVAASLGDDGRYHIRMVVGPDEYHEGVDDNAYTNVLARWNIRKAVEALAWLDRVDSGYADELRMRLELDNDEMEGWLQVADALVDGFDPATKLFEQFAGFYEMDDVPIEKLRPRPMAADLMLGREVTLHAKVVKQADVVMLCHILSDEYGDDVARANYDYYEPITSHGSSLSPGIHAAVAARLGGGGRRRGGLQDGGRHRPGGQHGQRRARPAHGHHGRPLAGRGDGLRRTAAPRRGAAHRPAPAAGLEAGARAAVVPRRARGVRPAPPQGRRRGGYNRREGAA